LVELVDLFNWTEEEQLMFNVAKDFIENEIKPKAMEIDLSPQGFPVELHKRFCELGFGGLIVPEAFGGLGCSHKLSCAITEEIAKVSPACAFVMLPVDALTLLAFEGGRKYVDAVANGERIFAFAVCDPAGQFNWDQHPVFAKRDGDGWILNGTKMFVTKGGVATVIVAIGRCDDGKYRMFLIDTEEHPGYQVKKVERKIGMNGTNNAVVSIQNVRIPNSSLVSEADLRDAQKKGHQWNKVDATLVALGAAKGCLDKTIEYINMREAKNRPLSSMSLVADRIARAASKIEIHRVFAYIVADGIERGDLPRHYVPMLKANGVDAAIEAVKSCLELWGGLGVCEDTGISRYMRDVLTLLPADNPADALLQRVAYCYGVNGGYSIVED